MDKAYKQALRDNQEKVAGVIVMNILPDLRPYLTDIEYSQVESMQPDNRAQVNELFRVLLMKEDAHFFSFCHALECNGYWHWAQQLQEASSAHIHAGGRRTNLRECSLCCFNVDVVLWLLALLRHNHKYCNFNKLRLTN